MVLKKDARRESTLWSQRNKLNGRLTRAFYLMVLKASAGRKNTLKISIARIPFLCYCLYSAMKYFIFLQRKKWRKGENRLFSSHVQVLAASLSHVWSSNIYGIFYCLYQLAYPREGNIIPKCTSTSPHSLSSLLTSGKAD